MLKNDKFWVLQPNLRLYNNSQIFRISTSPQCCKMSNFKFPVNFEIVAWKSNFHDFDHSIVQQKSQILSFKSILRLYHKNQIFMIFYHSIMLKYVIFCVSGQIWDCSVKIKFLWFWPLHCGEKCEILSFRPNLRLKQESQMLIMIWTTPW